MNTKRAPKVRFKGFTDAWEQRKLGNFGKTYTGLSGKTKDDFGHGKAQFITYMNVYSNPIIDVEMTEPIEIDLKQNEVEIGDVFFTTSSETPEEVGMSSVLLKKCGTVYLNSFCFGFRPFIILDNYFLAYMLRAQVTRKQIILLAQGISRYNISKNKVMEINIFVPHDKEQQQLGKFFYKLDNLITLHQRKLDKMKELKKAFLNLIFSQKLRFYGFTDSWELRKLEEVAPLRGGYAFQSNQYANEGIPIVRISNILSDGSVGGEFVFHNELKDDEIFMLENGDIVLAMSGATTGKVSILSSEKSCKYYQNQRVGLFSKTATCNYSFVATIVRSEKFLEQLRDVLVAGAQPNVSAKDIDAFDFSVPKDVEEQSQIGNFFRTLDRLITLYQKKIDSSKEMKKILLKNMLI